MEKPVILFDIGGVLVRWKDIWLINEISEKFEISKKDLVMGFETHLTDLFTGKMSEDKFWRKVLGKAYTKTKSSQGIIDEVFSRRSIINQEVFELAKTLKGMGFKIGILSNITSETRRSLQRKGIFEIFDYRFFSDKIKSAKPHSQIFSKVQKKIGVKSSQIILIDDKDENIKAAQSHGFKTILYKEVNSLKLDLVSNIGIGAT